MATVRRLHTVCVCVCVCVIVLQVVWACSVRRSAVIILGIAPAAADGAAAPDAMHAHRGDRLAPLQLRLASQAA
jgi:hypothetical protein